MTYTVGNSGPLTITFTDFDITNCPFEIDVTFIADPSSPRPLDDNIFTIVQSTTVVGGSDANLVTVQEYASMIIETDD